MLKKSDLEKNLLSERQSSELEAFLYSTNPWWQGKPMRPLPPHKRWLFDTALQRLQSGLAPVTVLRGPRQVGKTTLQEQLIDHLLHTEKVAPERIFRVQFDEIALLTKLQEPILGLCHWYEHVILKRTLNEVAHDGITAFLFFDEVQNVTEWAPQVKSLVDHNMVRVFLTGSSALRIEYGRDSLAGRISTLELNTLQLREIATIRDWGSIPSMFPRNGLGMLKERDFWTEVKAHGITYRGLRDRAFEAFSQRGGYPIAQARPDRPWEEIADQLNETIIRRVIQHDLRIGERGRKRDQVLLEELFRFTCRYTGQAPGQALYVSELQSALAANIGWKRILAYLKFLNDTLLIRLIQPLEIRLKRQKGQPKLSLCDHSLRASWLQEIIPLTPAGLQANPQLSDLAGRIAESIVGYFLGGIPNLDLAWFPERPTEPEVDFIITVGEYRIPLEVKYRQRIEYRDTIGLRSFIEKAVYNASFGLLVTLTDDVEVRDPRIVTIPLSSLLLMR